VTARPSAQKAVTAILLAAGFKDATGPGPFRDGFAVTGHPHDFEAVRVRHSFRSMTRRAADLGPALARYASVIEAAGWAVETGRYDLTVTAPKTGG
jgi:hypothetical protein